MAAATNFSTQRMAYIQWAVAAASHTEAAGRTREATVGANIAHETTVAAFFNQRQVAVQCGELLLLALLLLAMLLLYKRVSGCAICAAPAQ